MTEDAAKSPARRRTPVVVGGGLAGIAVGMAAVYGISTFLGNPAANATCNKAVDTARRLEPFARGEVAAMAVATKPLKVPNLTFADAGIVPRHLADWRGRTVLLNLWATWCIPCRREMPALDALQARLGDYADREAKVFQDLKVAGRALGMPTTMLVDPAGCELGTMSGPAEWASDDAIKPGTAAPADRKSTR